jgi:predicted NAD-dependent protein-ADP-ribosyltransferase YbiA (DUF1768 family)
VRALAVVLVLLACGVARAEDVAAVRSGYPAEWFAPLPEGTKAASWEITPDAAKAGEVILSKRTPLGVFSNFAATPFELDGKKYASIEGLWQSLYYPEDEKDPRFAAGKWPRTRAEVEQLTAFVAKGAGNDARKILEPARLFYMSYKGRKFEPYGSDDDQKFHRALMERATRAKVEQNASVKDLLLKTGDLKLRPDHDQGPKATPAYRYFEILEDLRAEYRRASR